MFQHTIRNRALLVVALWATGLSASAQQANDAVLVGSVLDSSQASISGARVKLTHVKTNGVKEVRTDDRGQFRTPPLRIGEYTVRIEASGFKAFNQRGLVLEIGDVRQLDAVLGIGQVTDSVDVESAVPLLQTADSTVGTVINNKQIEDLPLNGRDYLQLAAPFIGHGSIDRHQRRDQRRGASRQPGSISIGRTGQQQSADHHWALRAERNH